MKKIVLRVMKSMEIKVRSEKLVRNLKWVDQLVGMKVLDRGQSCRD
jgi:hypothetical protein